MPTHIDHPPDRTAAADAALRFGTAAVPAVLLLGVGLTVPPHHQPPVWAGVLLTGVLAGLLLMAGRGPWAMPAIAVYLIGLVWLWMTGRAAPVWAARLAEACLITIPLFLFAGRIIASSGAAALRQARLLTQRLARRRDWPADLRDCRHLPEVKALRQSLHADAAPALPLLNHPRLNVRVAVLCALEFRKSWRPGQAELVLRLAQTSPEPALRSAAVSALANVGHKTVVEGLARFLLDPVAEVRRAAVEALFWDHPHRWPWVRESVRSALSHPQLAEEGPLTCGNAPLAEQAVADLHRWAQEGNLLAWRSTQTLAAHYAQVLQSGTEPGLVLRLTEQLLDARVPAALRVELMHLLHDAEQVTPDLAERLLESGQPSPLRLLAAECLLLLGLHPRAVSVLREVARQTNREQAVSAAAVVQRCLGVDLGLGLNQPLPDPGTRQAADVARRVMLWAIQPVPEGRTHARTPVTPVRDPEQRPWNFLKPPNSDPKGSGAGSGVR